MWIWLSLLFIGSIISLFYSIYSFFPFYARHRFINKLIFSSEDKKRHTYDPIESNPMRQPATTTEQNPIVEEEFEMDFNRRNHFVHWLQLDGVFLIHLINSHAGEPTAIRCVEHLVEFWKKNYEDQTKLAEKLLHNHFHF